MPPQAREVDIVSVSQMENQMATEKTPQKPQKEKRSVRFNELTEVRPIPNLDTYTDIDLYRMWNDPEEFQAIRNNALEVAEQLREGLPETEERCYRGLEWKAHGATRRRKLVRSRAAEVVFTEQEKQWDREEQSPFRIAAVYMVYSELCIEDAFRRACLDSQDARAYLEESDGSQKHGKAWLFSRYSSVSPKKKKKSTGKRLKVPFLSTASARS